MDIANWIESKRPVSLDDELAELQRLKALRSGQSLDLVLSESERLDAAAQSEWLRRTRNLVGADKRA